MKLSIIQKFQNLIFVINNAYILEKGDITVTAAPKTQVAFTKSITKIDGTTIGDLEDLDLVIPMYNLIEYSSNYSEAKGSLWFYSKDEATNSSDDIANNNNFKSFEYKDKLLGNTVSQPNPNNVNGILRNATIAVP